MVLTLTLNASEKRIQFLLAEEENLLCAQDWTARSGGAELLAPALEYACRTLGRAAADIGRIACVAGPGSFTGLRLATATASALARTNGAKLAPLHYLEALAAGIPAPLMNKGQLVHVAVNAKQGWYYSGLYRFTQGLPQAVIPPVLRKADPAALPSIDFDNTDSQESYAEYENADPLCRADVLIGSAIRSNPDYFHALSPNAAMLPPAWDQPQAAALATLTAAVDWDAAHTHDIAPLYLRECDAVDNLDHIARTQGLDPQKAHSRLHQLMESPLED